jgi:hypothetical protein
MIARGCTVNGANTILIDVNQHELEAVQAELNNLASSAGSTPLSVIALVLTRADQATR